MEGKETSTPLNIRDELCDGMSVSLVPAVSYSPHNKPVREMSCPPPDRQLEKWRLRQVTWCAPGCRATERWSQGTPVS